MSHAMSEQQPNSISDAGYARRPDSPTVVVPAAPRVMVVDDDPAIRLLMRETLAEAGFEVSVASCGPEAIDLCPAFEPDLLLLDINMPLMSGITACTEIRKASERNFPIVMVTSVDDAVSIQRAFDAGANDFILKPLNWPLFQRRLDSILAEWNKSQVLDESNNRVRLLEKVAPEQAMLVSRSGTIIENLKSRSDTTPINAKTRYKTLDEVFGCDLASRFKQKISGVLKTRRHNTLEFEISKHGMSSQFEAQFLVDGRDRVIVVVQDVSDDKQVESDIYDLAFYDSITDLPNDHLFERIANEALIDASLHEGSLAIVSLCFDNISTEDLADRRTMLAVADRLRNCLDNCDSIRQMGDGDSAASVAQADPNRFLFVLHNVETLNDVNAVCHRIAEGFAKPVISDSGSITISPRLGVAAFPTDGRSLQTVQHAAHSAMHEAQETGQTVCFNSQASTIQKFDLVDGAAELRRAMDDGQLELYYQPRLSMPDGTVTCVEALLRWNHPMRGFVDLQEVLQLAKSTGLIIPLGDWVLRTACEEARRWQGTCQPRVSVNLSQQEFAREDLARRVIEALDLAGLDPGRIDLEFTEAVLLRTRNGLADLRKLKDLGVGLVLDDFGTGHTSLGSLKHYPIDALKIDRSFVRDLPDSQDDAVICEVIITTAHKMGMKAVAEGVETLAQLEFLKARACDEFQGFYLCRPLPANEIGGFLSKPEKP